MVLNFRNMVGDCKMKKLLVLVMVLGLVATANAGLCTLLPSGSTTLAVGSTLLIEVVSADTSGQSMNLELDDTAAEAAAQIGSYSHGDWVYTGGNVQGMTQYAAAGNLAGIQGPTLTGYPGFYWFTGAGTPGGTPTAGEWFSIVYKCTGLGDTYISLYNDTSATVISQLLVHQVPEPITIGLLGLGGLFLRRRK